MRASVVVLLVVALAACSSEPDPAAVLERLDGDLACYDDQPPVEDGTAACATRWGMVRLSYVGNAGVYLGVLLEHGRDFAGETVWHPDGWVAHTDGNRAAEELARQLGGDVVTEAFFRREFLD